MKIRTLLWSMMLLSSAAPALAELRPIAPEDVSRFVGVEVRGAAHADLGVVSSVDPNLGLVSISGKHGEFVVLHVSLLRSDGLQIFTAPDINVGNFGDLSTHRMAFYDMVAVAKTNLTPSITVTETPYVEVERDQLPAAAP